MTRRSTVVSWAIMSHDGSPWIADHGGSPWIADKRADCGTDGRLSAGQSHARTACPMCSRPTANAEPRTAWGKVGRHCVLGVRK